MWKQIRSFFGGPLDKADSLLEFDAIRSEVEAVLKLNLASKQNRDANNLMVFNALRHLEREIELVRQQANGYPAHPISALVWMNGAGYGNLAQTLTLHFQNAGWLEREEKASALWARATLAVCAHYHHMVGPAMLANADCHERLGNTDRAAQMYQGIVQDFAFLVEDWSQEKAPPGEEERLALESLKTATARLLSREIRQIEDIDLPQLQSQIAKILLRPRSQCLG